MVAFRRLIRQSRARLNARFGGATQRAVIEVFQQRLGGPSAAQESRLLAEQRALVATLRGIRDLPALPLSNLERRIFSLASLGYGLTVSQRALSWLGLMPAWLSASIETVLSIV